mgnify:CR=1 FL=1
MLGLVLAGGLACGEAVVVCPQGTASDPARARRMARLIQAGMTTVNDFGLAYMIQSLPFGGVKISGFGNFVVREKKPRPGRNPQTGAEVKIPARSVPKFSAGKGLKEAVN